MDKAYKNNDFMMGRDARPLRILSEYLEPQSRFARYRIADTVVFFGSARALPHDLASEELENAKATGNETTDAVSNIHRGSEAPLNSAPKTVGIIKYPTNDRAAHAIPHNSVSPGKMLRK